jgi:hypothetical protein
MLHDIDSRLYEWGDYVRERQDFGLGYPQRNVIHKAMREGLGASEATGHRDSPMPTPIGEIESALLGVTGPLKETAKQRYVAHVPDKVAAQRMRISVAQYRQRIDQLHYYIAGVVGSPPT